MPNVRSHRDLVAWQKAMDFVVAIYRATDRLPVDERYGLTSQIHRAVVSIPSNMAEGHGRTSTSEFLHFLSIARGSLCELETQILSAERLSYLSGDVRDDLLRQADEVGRLLRGLTRSLSSRRDS